MATHLRVKYTDRFNTGIVTIGFVEAGLYHGKNEIIQLSDDFIFASRLQFWDFEQTQSITRFVLQ